MDPEVVIDDASIYSYSAWAKWTWCFIAIVAEIAGGHYMKEARAFADRRRAFLAFLYCNICCFALIYFLDNTDLSIGWAIYTALQFCGVMFIGVVHSGERLTKWKAIGLVVTTIGVAILVLEDELGGVASVFTGTVTIPLPGPFADKGPLPIDLPALDSNLTLRARKHGEDIDDANEKQALVEGLIRAGFEKWLIAEFHHLSPTAASWVKKAAQKNSESARVFRNRGTRLQVYLTGLSCSARAAYAIAHELTLIEVGKQGGPKSAALNAVACPEMVDIAVLEHPMNRIAAVLADNMNPAYQLLDNTHVRILADAWDVPRNEVTKEHFLVALEKLTAFDLVAVLDENSREIAWSGEGLAAVLGWKHIPAVKGLQKLKRGRGEWKRLSVANKWDVALYQRAKEALHQKKWKPHTRDPKAMSDYYRATHATEQIASLR
jgi:multidrug transporter EmrE-like cation transporter